MVFIGYELGSKAYRMYDLVARRVCVSRDVIFDEVTFWDWGSHKANEGGEEDFTVEHYTTPLIESGVPIGTEETGNEVQDDMSPGATAAPMVASPASPTILAMATLGATTGVEFYTPPPPTDASTGTDEGPRCYRTVANTLATTTPILDFDYNDESIEHAVYTRGKGDSRLIVGVYVDDLIITGANMLEVDKFKKQMQKLFSMSDLGLLSYYLGMEVCQTKEFVTVCQAAYAEKIGSRAGMEGCNATHVPMESRLKLTKEGSGKPVDATLYRSVVGSLR
ncbi:hypothetical protein E2562_036418 [Oryza meyeriana var. granulata]|uniref:Uncharacterized protein n=1 Tax=Oryza meyeriana var. granulata TaxID=110450 RepID=A0A6G1E7M7_9ORYZ|nr:hypothetical protein E2562_036418 [Oryza meyeriana var. granulata]